MIKLFETFQINANDRGYMMKVAIIDSNLTWRKYLKREVKEIVDKIDYVDTFKSGMEFLNSNRIYSVLLVDMDTQHNYGFETIKKYRKVNSNIIVMIMTNNLAYARKGYHLNAFRCIDKTNMKEELSEAFEKIKKRREMNKVIFSLIGKSREKIKKISIEDILYIETEGRGAIIVTDDKNYKSEEKISELQEKLKAFNFFRCHQSFLINLKKVEHLDKEFAYFLNDKKAYVSTRRYKEIKRRYLFTKKQ